MTGLPHFICWELAVNSFLTFQPHHGADRHVLVHGAEPGDGGVHGEGEAHLPPRLRQDQHVRGKGFMLKMSNSGDPHIFEDLDPNLNIFFYPDPLLEKVKSFLT